MVKVYYYSCSLVRLFVIFSLAAVFTAMNASVSFSQSLREGTIYDFGAEMRTKCGALSKSIQDHAKEVRNSCNEYSEEFKVSHEIQGIRQIKLGGDPAFVVDNEELCGAHLAGANCSNRGCDILIYTKDFSGRFRGVFSYHAHGKVVMYKGDNWDVLSAIAITILAGSRECKPSPKRDYRSGESCNLLVRYKNGMWWWEKLD